MTREDIVRMAREAHLELVTKDYPGHTGTLDPWTMRLLERFAALVAADERISEANIGIAGFGAKVKPARQNPYGITPPQRKPLTDEGIEEICWTEVDQRLRSFARGSEAKLKEKNA